MPIAFADLLTEQQVILRLRSRKPTNAIREIVDVLASDISGRKIAKPEAFLKEVLAREQKHPSAVENGVAFPHARTDLVDEIVIGVGRSRAGRIRVEKEGADDPALHPSKGQEMGSRRVHDSLRLPVHLDLP